jgi:hypothetical protein
MLNKVSARNRASISRAIAEALEPRAYLSAVTFAAPITVPVAGATGTAGQFASTVAADFNGDGLPDYATLDTANDTLDIMLNKGNGTFTAGQSLATGRDPGSLQAATLSNGNVDLLFVNSADATVEFYTGNGDGTFSTTPTSFSYGQAQAAGSTAAVPAASVVAADVIGNGNPDIVVGTGNNVLFTFLNQGSDQFNQSNAIAGELGGVGQFFNTSTANDIVGALTDGTVQIFVDNGTQLAVNGTAQLVPGSLSNSTLYHVTSNLVVGDFNNDGNADVAAVITDSQTNISYLSVLLGQGNGTFETPHLTAITPGVTRIQVGSFTSSGNQDMLLAYPTYTDVYTGNGDGSFTDAKLTIPETGWTSAGIADFNGDGLLDAQFGNSLLLNSTGLKASETFLSTTTNTVAPGQQVTLNAKVTGTSGSPTGDVAFYDITSTSAEKLLGVGKVSGGSASISASLGGTTETHQIIADYTGDTTFSASTSNALGETVEPGGGVPTGPTILTPTITKETIPTSAPADTKLTNASVSVKLTNSTDTDAKGPVTINVYAAPTTTLNTGVDTLLTQVSKNETLKVQKSGNLSIPIKSLPSNLDGGTYYVIVETVDTAGTASAVSTGKFSVAAPFIALSEQPMSLKLPPTIVGGVSFSGSSVKLKITNSGNITDDGFTINLTASADATAAGSTFLTVKEGAKIAPGKSVTVTVPIKSLPVSLVGGPYDLVAQTIDSNGTASIVSAGTFSVAAPVLSLSEVVKSLKLPTTIVNGTKLTGSSIDLTVTNTGNVTDDGFTIDLSASQATDQPESTFLEVKKSTKIAPGKSVGVMIALKTLPTLAAGSYYIVAQTTDSNGVTTLATSGTQFTISS